MERAPSGVRESLERVTQALVSEKSDHGEVEDDGKEKVGRGKTHGLEVR